MIDLQMEVLELIQKQQDLIFDNGTLRAKIKELETQISRSKDVRFNGTIYYTVENGKEDGPFCPVCYDKERKLVRLHDGRQRVAQARWLCLVCNAVFEPVGPQRQFPETLGEALPGAWAG